MSDCTARRGLGTDDPDESVKSYYVFSCPLHLFKVPVPQTFVF